MRSLVVTTGQERFIMNTWLPSLRDKGKYEGNVLIVDYESSNNYAAHISNMERGIYSLESFKPETVQYLQKQPNLIYHKVKNKYAIIPSDRINAFNTVLTELEIWDKYDTFLFTDGNDITFLKPIQPLLEASQRQICAVKEQCHLFSIGLWNVNQYLKMFYSRNLENEQIINAGVIAGPPDEIKKLFEYILLYLQLHWDGFGAEQFSLNSYLYSGNVDWHPLGYEWNCLLRGYNRFKIEVDNESGAVISASVSLKGETREICILHQHDRDITNFKNQGYILQIINPA